MKKRLVAFMVAVGVFYSFAAFAAGPEKSAETGAPNAAGASASSSPTRAIASEMPPVVQQEYVKTQQGLVNELNRLKAKIRLLKQQSRQAIVQSHAATKLDELGVKTLQDYELLMVERHTDDHNEFMPGSELAPEEIETLNKLFYAFLTMTPFQKRVSTGQAKKQLQWAIGRLGDLAKVHGDPDDSNNSELQIIAKQIKDAEIAEKRIELTAEKLNFKLDAPMAASPRMPASSSGAAANAAAASAAAAAAAAQSQD